jgi:hypothetical protein
MPARKATASGKWSQSIWDVTPGVGDDVFANNFTVEIDQNINVGSLRTTLSSGYAVAGGGFTLYQPLSVIASPRGFLAGTTTCITGLLSSGTSILSGNVTGGSVALAHGVNNNGAGNVNIFGNVLAGSIATAYGSINSSTGNVTVVGNVSGSSTSTGLYNNASGNFYVFGEVRPGAGITSSNGIQNASTGNIYVTGNVIAGTVVGNNSTIGNTSVGAVVVVGNVSGSTGTGTHAINNFSTGTLLVSGTITASANAHGVVSASTAARNEFTGTLVNSISGRQAVYCAKYLVHPKMFDSATVQAVDRTGTYVSYFAPEAYSTTFVPHTSSVALGTAYAAVSSLSGVVVNIPVQLSGTMVVPSAGSVSLGTLVGQTTGTAILNSQDLQNVWNTNINTLTTDGTIFKRLANSATVSDVGTVLQNINL